ncbi:MAG: DUF5916 domain-containing protein [Bacteroidota bacterium]
MKHVQLLFLLLFPFFLLGQMDLSLLDDGIFLKRTSEKITLDGELNEASWYKGNPATNFWENFPSDTTLCEWKTEIYMAYDDDFLYIGAKCYSAGQDYVVPSLRRDYRAGGSDNLTLVLDPFRDNTNAFVFGMNPYGVMREALISNGGNNVRDFQEAWDNKWKGESAIFDNYWSCELAIPLTSIRYPEGETEWYFNSYRFDTQTNTRSTWQPIPRNQMIMSLAYSGNMKWEEAPGKQGASISVIPYITGGIQKDYEEGTAASRTSNIGGDAKVAVTSGLNLDLTVNPDFSQVEVDQQVVNLSRFEVRFPERRQFFLENSDLFGSFGNSFRANPFFSRRIGVASDTTDESFSTPIYYGARLSGKLGNDWRVGLLNMQTASDVERLYPGYNFTVAALQRKLFSRSNMGIIVVNKQAFGDINEEAEETYNKFNRVVGVDYNLASADNSWNGKFYYHHSFSPDQGSAPSSQGASIQYRVRDYGFGITQRYVGDDFDAELGFVPRRNYFQVNPRAELFFYPENGSINRHGPRLRTFFIWQPEDGNTDRDIFLSWEFNYNNTSNLTFTASNQYIFLFDEFDPSRTDATPLPQGTDYNYSRFRIEYRSDRRKKFSYRLEPSIGEFFNGYRYGLESSLTWRYQPLGQIALTTNYNYIDLPDPYVTTSLFLIGSRIDLTFSKSLFLTTFVQFNDQIDNLNINARFQWRFAPVSDFFLVYTDNYNSLDWGVRNRGLVAKVTYWLNT